MPSWVGRPSAATASRRPSGQSDPSRRSSAPAARARSIGPRLSGAPATSTRSSAHTTRTRTWPSACAGLDIAASSPRARWSTTTSRRPTTTAVRASQRRMARNAEFVFWANLPSALLAAALVPHLAFLAIQALWRLAHGRLGPFLLGKCDAIRAWPEIRARRQRRLELAQTAAGRPHFALRTGSLRDVRNHLKRPKERSHSGRNYT